MMELSEELAVRYEKLKQILREMNHVAVAFSGGVDSTFLVKVAAMELKDQVVAITARHHAVPEREQRAAQDFCQAEGIRLIAVRVNEMEIPGFRENPPDRCYLCKKEIFGNLLAIGQDYFNELLNGEMADGEKRAAVYGRDWFIADGSNLDDQGDYRPGMRALKELNVRSPLKEAGMTKQDIRTLSRYLALPTWDQPSFACLASRFVYGEEITPEKLSMVEKAEEFLRQKGFHQYRVRMHQRLARIEVLKEELEKLVGIREEVNEYFLSLGFQYVTLDLNGFVSGSMNKALKQ